MYKNGKKINKTRKYTYDEMRRVAIETAAKINHEIADTFFHVSLMAYIDSGGTDTDGFIELLNKYCSNYKDGDYTKTALRKYNTDKIREFFKGR